MQKIASIFKNLFKQKVDSEKEELKKKVIELRQVISKQREAAYFLVNRHYIHSIGVDDMEDPLEELDESQKRDHIANASVVFSNPVFQKEIKYLFGSQALFVSSQCTNWEQSLIGRGTMNGIGLFEDRFKKLHSLHLENLKNSQGSIEENDGKVIDPV